MSTLSRTRPSVGGLNGAVASAHPLASQAGLETLRNGGNAIDAIVATAATLNVVEPYMSGIGGVGFLLFHPAGGDTRVLNFSGYAPRAATADQLTPEDQDIGPKACLVPCNLGGWLEALQAHGTQPADQVFSRAIELAERGFPLHPVNARMIEATLPRLNEAGHAIYGQVEPRIGSVLRQPALAETLRDLAAHGAEWFHGGSLGEKMADYIQSEGGLLTTVGWSLGGKVTYCLEGAVFVGGAVVQWLRDGLGLISQASEIEALAAECESTDGVYLVPAFVGLGAPYWDPSARGTVIGITRGTARPQLARAALESIAYQSRDLLELMQREAGVRLEGLRVDGGASANDLLMQFQADLLDVDVLRPEILETTALGAARFAGLATGFWESAEEIAAAWRLERQFSCEMDNAERQRLYEGWQRAVKRSRDWAE